MDCGDITMDDYYAINAAKTEIREGYNTGDVSRILAAFADSLTDMSDGHPSFYEGDAKTVLKARLEKLFREYTVEMAPTIIEIIVEGDVAIDRGWHEMTLRPKIGGAEERRRTRYMEIWRRDARNGWRIEVFIDNADQDPELTTGELAAAVG